MNSPKGKYRLKEFALGAVIFLIAVAISGGYDMHGEWHIDRMLNPNGWIFKQLNNVAEICIGLFLLYFGHRVINHFRTHDLVCKKTCSKDYKALIITCVWVLAISFVVGNGLR